ncbi:ubiquinol-cytochrome C reductase, partial [Nadsonia fulvescens var. elongata DSM 6958]
IYNTFIKRNSVFVGTIFFAAFAFDVGYGYTMDKVFDNINKGKQWKDIRHKYVEDEE